MRVGGEGGHADASRVVAGQRHGAVRMPEPDHARRAAGCDQRRVGPGDYGEFGDGAVVLADQLRVARAAVGVPEPDFPVRATTDDVPDVTVGKCGQRPDFADVVTLEFLDLRAKPRVPEPYDPVRSTTRWMIPGEGGQDKARVSMIKV